MEITFIRHGPPEFDNSRWLHQDDLMQLLAEYRAARVVVPAPPDLLSSTVEHSCDAVVCSTLARSIDSASALGFPNALRISELDEADLPCPRWRKIPVAYRVAVVALRVMWLLGYSRGCDSYRLTKIRADQAAIQLIDLAKIHGKLLVVGHGIMNRLVCKKLTQLGWIRSDRGGSGYWSATGVTVLR